MDRSSMSLRMPSRLSPDWRMTSSRSTCFAGRASRAMAWAMPRTPLRGVRTSWLMTARKADLAALAALASLTA
ncbi:hypothetical protein D3C86_1856380 [compost metagenome]